MKRSRRDRRREGAFTLIEVLLVMMILVIMAGFVVMEIGPQQKKAKVDAAKAQIGLFSTPLDTYQLDVGSYPSTAAGLNALITAPGEVPDPSAWHGPYLKAAVPPDPWGRPYQYMSPGSHNPYSYDVWTVSEDGVTIGNWK